MRILIATAGSQGDVAPYIGLGRRLAQAGHEVSLATHTTFETAARHAGLGFRALPVDPRSELASDRGQRLLRAGAGPLAVAELLRMGRRFMPALGRGILEAVRHGTDLLLLAATTAPLGQAVAEAHDLPSAGVFLQPLYPTGEFLPVVAGTSASLGRRGNLLAGHTAQLAVDRLFAPAVRDLRRQLGLPARTAAGLRRRHARQAWPVLHGFSPSVVPRPADWAPSARVSGYWWPHTPADWQPPAQLADFLRAGPPPVYVGFGSLVVADPGRLGEVITAALRTARLRAVVQRGWSGLSVESRDVLVVDEVPHAWLFPRMAAVVHHAGAGTTAAGLRAGVPAVPVPAQLDATFWATRLTALGVSPGPVPLRRLSAERLAVGLRRAVDEPAYRVRAREVADRIGAEDGAADVLELAARISAG
ncbi:glycosyltransferase [Kitasatospora atroaurantiaca]|uniref:UDP:flavonoid glycosyltransferase YjiC (YdhE family) n=1 Tax=Kitasatospora atroaurantiaca TaxID=285545 RepID=A0A561EXV6_9ACTN|nr:glycosyltransferase [Kitasatospora atroaurantiaca]TWE20443.1 UDP:flavonoid glycosyltransferase YjiC (YdhE family) [Kitasatospora atroaurantiaca]